MQYFYWEAIDLVRRIVLTGGLLIIRDSVVTIRSIMALLTSFVWVALLFSTYPFKRFDLDVLAITSAFVLTCIHLGALLVKIHENLRDSLAAYVGGRFIFEDITAIIASTLSFENSETIVALVLVFTVAVLTFVACALVQRLWEEGREQTFRLRAGEEPDLTLQQGHRWHLFLSRALLPVVPNQRQNLLTASNAYLVPLSLADVWSSGQE